MDRLSSLLAFFTPQTDFVRCEAAAQPVLAQLSAYHGSDILLIESGQAQLTIADARHTFVTGDLVWLPLGQPFELTGIEECRWVQARMRFGNVTTNPLFYALPVCILLKGACHDVALQPIVSLMLDEAQKARCGYQTAVNRLAEVLLIHILRFTIGELGMEKGVIAGLGDIRLAKALTQIHDYPERPWSLAQLAQLAGMSRTAFSQHFRTVVGCPPGEYLKQWRMQLGYQWLGEGQLSVGQVADKLGYQSETAFRRVFKQVIGQPPGSVRRQAGEVS